MAAEGKLRPLPGGVVWIDLYNGTALRNIVGTILARYNASNHYYIGLTEIIWKQKPR